MTLKSSDLTQPSRLTDHERDTGPARTQCLVYVDLMPPCNHACPAGESIQAWLALRCGGAHQQAWPAVVDDNPFPAIHGRVCYHPCETASNRRFERILKKRKS